MKLSTILLLFVFLFTACRSKTTQELAMQAAEEAFEAEKQNDFEKSIQFACPLKIKEFGGKEKMIAMLKRESKGTKGRATVKLDKVEEIKIDFDNLKMVVSTIPEIRENSMLIKKVKHANSETPVFVTCLQVDEALELYDAGADYVILPHFLGGEHVNLMLEDISQDVTKLVTNKAAHIKELHIRKEQHPHHY